MSKTKQRKSGSCFILVHYSLLTQCFVIAIWYNNSFGATLPKSLLHGVFSTPFLHLPFPVYNEVHAFHLLQILYITTEMNEDKPHKCLAQRIPCPVMNPWCLSPPSPDEGHTYLNQDTITCRAEGQDTWRKMVSVSWVRLGGKPPSENNRFLGHRGDGG